MDPAERLYKLGLDAALTAAFVAFVRLSGRRMANLALSALCAHTLNFLGNGHIWGALKWHGIAPMAPDALLLHLQAISSRLNRSSAIEAVFVYGSLSRD